MLHYLIETRNNRICKYSDPLYESIVDVGVGGVALRVPGGTALGWLVQSAEAPPAETNEG